LPNELGLHDMTGNLWEFCGDEFSRVAYRAGERINPAYSPAVDSEAIVSIVTRGGGYEFDADESLVFRRDGASSNVRLADVGFRLAMDR